MADPALKMVEDEQGNAQKAKRTKFVQLAEKRTVNAIKAIRVIGKLGNRSAYEYEDDDVKKIVKALTDEVEALKSRMRSTKRTDGVDFKL